MGPPAGGTVVGMRTPRSIYLPSRGRYSYIYIKLPSPPGPIMVGTASWEDGVGPLPPLPPWGGGRGGRRRGLRLGGPEGWGRECRVVLGVEKTPVGLARTCHGSVAKLCLLLGWGGGSTRALSFAGRFSSRTLWLRPSRRCMPA